MRVLMKNAYIAQAYQGKNGWTYCQIFSDGSEFNIGMKVPSEQVPRGETVNIEGELTGRMWPDGAGGRPRQNLSMAEPIFKAS